MKKYKDIISEDIVFFKKICYKLDSIISLNNNGKFIISQEKAKGLLDMSKYALGKRIQEINLLDESGEESSCNPPPHRSSETKDGSERWKSTVDTYILRRKSCGEEEQCDPPP